MKDGTLMRTGVIGSTVMAICCFTPLLVVTLGVVGLSAWLGWLDFVLFPALGFFLALTGYALWRQRNAKLCRNEETLSNENEKAS